jgi:hypothetical protein
MIRATNTVLHDAIAQKAAAVFSFPGCEGLQHCKTRFLGAGDDGFCLEAPPLGPGVVEKLIAAAQPVGVGFMCSTGRAAFSTTLVRQIAQYPVDGHATSAMLLVFPARISVIQPRSSERVPVTPESGIVVRLSRRDLPGTSHVLSPKLVKVEPFNLSLGGIGVVCPAAHVRDIPMGLGQLLRVSIAAPGRELALDGSVRHTKVLPDCSVRIGIQFEESPEQTGGAQDLVAAIIAMLRQRNTEAGAGAAEKATSPA